MQHKLSSQCIDFNLINLNEHLVSANLASDCCAPPDDVQIATGQASFDDGDDPVELSTWADSHRFHGLMEDSDDVLAESDYSPSQAYSAPARGWDIGRFERFDSRAATQYEGSSSLEEREPWSHLQTLALSAPQQGDQSSQDFQIESSPHFPLSSQDYSMLHPATINLRHQRQAHAQHQRMQTSPNYVEEDSTQRSNRRRSGKGARSPNTPDFDTFQPRNLRTPAQQVTGTSTSSSYSQSAISGPYMETENIGTKMAYSAHRPSFSGSKRRDTGLRQDPDIDFATFDQGLIDESGNNSLPARQDVLNSQDLSWQHHDEFLAEHQFSTSADTEYGSYGLDFTNYDPAWSPDLVQEPAFEFFNSHTQEHPGAIKIGGSSINYTTDLPSSFPPSAERFPDYMPPMQDQVMTSTSEPTFLSSSPPNLPSRRQSNKSTSARASRSNSLSIIREYGHSQHGISNLSRNGSGKGKRKGPLPTATALAAAQKRKDGSVCIRCRTMKMTCKGGLPCEGCRQITKVKLWDQTCTPANFTDIVKEGTCNAVFQPAITHLALDGSRRLEVAVPKAFDVSVLLDRLKSCQSRYDIRVRQSSGASFTLDLSNCLKTLTKIQKSCGLDTCSVQDFVKNKQSRSAWLQCTREYGLAASIVDRSIQWNNMPNRNSYEVLPHNMAVLGHALDVEDQQDRGTIIFASQLCRIILRALEIEAFDALQKSVNELTKGGKAEIDIEILIGQLSRILMSLRVSWWAVVGDSADESFTSRVEKLAQILYCYFFVARKKMSPWSGQLPSNFRSVYADFEPVYEDLPVTDSLDGFRAWMQKGQAVVKAAKIQQNTTQCWPTAPTNPHF